MSVSSSSSSSAPEVRGEKRAYSSAQLDAICADDIEPIATAIEVLKECGDDLECVVRTEKQLGAAADALLKIRSFIQTEKRARYGEVFQCFKCKMHLNVKNRMSLYGGSRSHKHALDTGYRGADHPCLAAICYECAMKSDKVCPVCNTAFACWLDGPLPYVIVMDKRSKEHYWGKPTRLELDPDVVTVSELAKLMGVKPGQFANQDGRCGGKISDWPLVDVGVRVANYTSQSFAPSDRRMLRLEKK